MSDRARLFLPWLTFRSDRYSYRGALESFPLPRNSVFPLLGEVPAQFESFSELIGFAGLQGSPAAYWRDAITKNKVRITQFLPVDDDLPSPSTEFTGVSPSFSRMKESITNGGCVYGGSRLTSSARIAA